MRAVIISAFPACGKSFIFNKNKEGGEKYITPEPIKPEIKDWGEFELSPKERAYRQKLHARQHEEALGGMMNWKILDSDSSQFSWTVNEDGKKVRNPEFPANYIQHIKDNLDTADVIFVSSHLNVRQALTDAGLEFITVYPEDTLMAEWIGRCYLRGNDATFIEFIKNSWDKFMTDLPNEPTGRKVYRLSSCQYLSDILPDIVWENVEPEIDSRYLQNIREEVKDFYEEFASSGKDRMEHNIDGYGSIEAYTHKLSVEIILGDLGTFYQRRGYNFFRNDRDGLLPNRNSSDYAPKLDFVLSALGLADIADYAAFNTRLVIPNSDGLARGVEKLIMTIDIPTERLSD